MIKYYIVDYKKKQLKCQILLEDNCFQNLKSNNKEYCFIIEKLTGQTFKAIECSNKDEAIHKSAELNCMNYPPIIRSNWTQYWVKLIRNVKLSQVLGSFTNFFKSGHIISNDYIAVEIDFNNKNKIAKLI